MRLTKPIGYFLVFAILAGVFVVLSAGLRPDAASRSDTSLFPFRIETVVSMPITSVRPLIIADVDLDGNDDLLVNQHDRLLWYRLHGNEVTLAGERAYEYPGSTRMAADVNGDGWLEFHVFCQTPEGAFLHCFNWFSPNEVSTPIYKVGLPILPGSPAWLLNINRISVRSFKTEKGTLPTFFIVFNSTRGEAACRSLIACDGATGQELWRLDLASYILSLECDDFGTGVPRVLVATGGLVRNTTCQGAADDFSQIVCLDQRDGRCLWSKSVTGYFGRSTLVLADVNGDGLKEILVGRYLAKGDSSVIKDDHPWTVAALNHEGAVLSTVQLPHEAPEISAANLDGDFYPEIIAEGIGRRLTILSHDFAKKREAIFPKDVGLTSIWTIGVGDFTGDGKQEIDRQMGDNIIVLNHKGATIAKRRFKEVVWRGIARYDGKSHNILVTGRGESSPHSPAFLVGDSIHVITLSRVPVADRLWAYSRRMTISTAAAVFLGGWAVFSILRLLKQRREKQIDFQEAQNELLTAMSAFGHGGSSLKTLDRLRLHLKNWERIRSDGATREELFARLLKIYRETIVPELEHLVMLARRASVPGGIWETLLSQARLAGQEMEGIFASGSEETVRRDEQIAKALAALDAVDGSIAGIRSHLRSVFCASVAEELDRLIARFRYDHGARGISFALVSDSSVGAAVFISPVSFGKIFEALLSNAVRATGGKPGAEIVTEVQWEGDYCRIDVRDNGCGISRDDWEHVFERHYSTKKEGGFGLHYAREELAKFGGKIYVADSVIGSGTTMRAVLRKSEKAGAV